MPVYFRDSKLRYARGIQLLFRHQKGLAFPSEPLVHAIAYRLQHDRVNAGLRVRSVQYDLALSILKGDDRPSVIFGCKACMFMLSTNVFESMLFCLSSIVAGNIPLDSSRVCRRRDMERGGLCDTFGAWPMFLQIRHVPRGSLCVMAGQGLRREAMQSAFVDFVYAID